MDRAAPALDAIKNIGIGLCDFQLIAEATLNDVQNSFKNTHFATVWTRTASLFSRQFMRQCEQ